MSNHSKQRGFFIKGDVSGIQEFIFNVKSEKAARVLNARSAYIQMYTRIVKEYLKERLKTSGTMEEFSEGGGSFFLYLSSDKSLKELETIIKDAEQVANEKGIVDELYIVLSIVEVKDDKRFDYWEDITRKSNVDKLRKYGFSSVGNSSATNPFSPFTYDGDKHDWISFAHERVKRDTFEYQAVAEEPYETGTFEDGIISLYQLFDLPERVPSELRTGIYKDKIQDKLPEWTPALRKSYKDEIENELKKRNAGIIDEKEKEQIRSYDIIDYSFLAYFAGERTGTEKLGILKMDVDSLGLLFQYQTNRTEAERVSKEIKSFFEERLYEMLQRNIKHDYDTEHREVNPDKYRDNIYTVFAGGDDCFFVGGWDTILDWAALVRKGFKTYVTEKNIIHPKTGKIPTISAGVVIVGAKFPVIRFAELAEEALSKAKASNRRGSKNKICLFDQVLTWKEFIKAKKWANKLKALIENGEKKSTLEQIKRSAIGFEKLQERAIDGKISTPKIANLFYYIRRNINEKNIETMEELVEEYKDALLEAFVKNRQRFSKDNEEEQETYLIKANPMVLPIAARIAEFKTRKNSKSDNNGKR